MDKETSAGQSEHEKVIVAARPLRFPSFTITLPLLHDLHTQTSAMAASRRPKLTKRYPTPEKPSLGPAGPVYL